MVFLTDFADQAVVLPVACAVLLGLLAMGWRRGALAWAVSVIGVMATITALKLVLLACGHRLAWDVPGWLHVVSPSGHTAASTVVYGGLLALLAPRSVAGTGVAVLAGGAVALLVGATRLALHVHTPGDVLAGACVGLVGAVLLRRLAGARPAVLSSPRLALAALVVMAAFHGQRLPAERQLKWFAADYWPLSLCRS